MSVFIKPKIKNNRLPKMEGKKVLIVGGTHGIGAELAIMCHTIGAVVIVVGKTRNDDLPEQIYQVIGNVFRMHLDHLYLGADYCFNNIGMYYKGTISETDDDKFREVIDKNLMIAYDLTRYAVRFLNPGGVLVNMASRPTLDKYHSWSAYTLAKQGVITLTKSAAEEGEIKAYSICPSRVDTKFRDEVFPDEDKKTRLHPAAVAEAVLKLFNGKNPNGEAYWIKEI